MSALAGADLNMVYASADAAKAAGAPSLGSVYIGEKGKAYKFVQYSEEAAAVDGVAGEVAYYLVTGGNEVTSDLSASSNVGAGVLQANMSEGECGWVQIKGIATLSIALTAGSDGNSLTPIGAGDGTLDVSALVTDHVCAVALDISEKVILCDFPW